MVFILGIEDGRVWVYDDADERHPIASAAELREFLVGRAQAAGVAVGELVVACSSTMDFPEESTADADTIKLAKELR